MNDERTHSLRMSVLAVFVFCSIGILMASLANIQIYHGAHFDALARENRIRLVTEPAPRGQILDRNKKVLAKVKFSYTASVFKEDIRSHREQIQFFLHEYSPYLTDADFTLNDAEKYPLNPVPLAENLDIRAITLIKENLKLSFLHIQKIPRRTYPLGNMGGHFLGTVGEISADKLKSLKKQGYKSGDIIGHSGIEAYYDRQLQGKKGGRQIEVDAYGSYIKSIGFLPPVAGKSIVLGIDADLQQLVESLLKNKKGAIVVLEPDTMEVLALASSPSYSPEDFSSGITPEKWRAILGNKDKPLLNRALSGAYPPGSVFKLITATAALEEGIVSPHSLFYCPGAYKLGNRTFRCWQRSGHGQINFMQGIEKSCDVVFYTIARKMGIQKLHDYAGLFGIGEKTGVDAPGEKPGLLPSPAWKKKRFRDPWYPGDTVNMGIGQGFLQTTPIQMARMTALFANGGKNIAPHFAHGYFKPPDGGAESLPVNPKNINIVAQGLIAVVRHGTGARAYIPGCEAAGKTGTAEDPPRRKPHAWFVGYAPIHNPKVAVSIFLEGGGRGGEMAAPLAKEIFKWACGMRTP